MAGLAGSEGCSYLIPVGSYCSRAPKGVSLCFCSSYTSFSCSQLSLAFVLLERFKATCLPKNLHQKMICSRAKKSRNIKWSFSGMGWLYSESLDFRFLTFLKWYNRFEFHWTFQAKLGCKNFPFSTFVGSQWIKITMALYRAHSIIHDLMLWAVDAATLDAERFRKSNHQDKNPWPSDEHS